MSIEQQALARTARAFVGVVWPTISPSLGGGQLISEEDPDRSSSLDNLGGVDYWQVRNGVLHSLASRVQWVLGYKSFTIRAVLRHGGPTELQKRAQAIATGGLYPERTVQAYLTDVGAVRAVGVVDTRALISVAVEYAGLYGLGAAWAHDGVSLKHPLGENGFLVINWPALERRGVPLLLWPTGQDTLTQLQGTLW